MPKRPIYLQSPDHSCRRTQRDLEFLYNYWNRLHAPNQNYDVRLVELLRVNHLMRHLSSLPSNHGLRVNMSFTILDDSNYLEPENISNTETYQVGNAPYYTELRNNGSCRSSCNAVGCNNLLRDYARRMNENYAAIERELMRARVLAPLIERDRIAGCQNAFYNQRAATNNWNKFPGSQTSAARIFPRMQERHVNPRDRNNHETCASLRHECCAADRMSKNTKRDCSTSQQSRHSDSPIANQLYNQNSLQTCFSCTASKKLQPNNNALQNRETAPDRNDNVMQQSSTKESMEACQGISKTVLSGAKTFPLMESRIKLDGVAINNDERSIDLQPNGQNNEPWPGSSIAMDQGRNAEGQGHSSKLSSDLEDRTVENYANQSNQSQSKTIEGIKSHQRSNVKDQTPILFSVNEDTMKTTRTTRIKNGRLMENRLFSRRRVSSPKYANFLRIFHKEDTDERHRGNSSSRKDKSEKLPQSRGLSIEKNPNTSNTEHDNRAIHDDPRIEKRTPTPRSTVHTTYNPIMHSSTSDPIVDSSSLTIQLLRLAVLLYAPTLMPALNSLIAQQNQTSVSVPSLEGSNDILAHISRLLSEQQAIPNSPFVSIGSERVSSALTSETNAGSSSIRTDEQENTSTATEQPSASNQGSISTRTSSRKSDNHVRQNGKDGRWRLTSMLDSAVRLDRNIFTANDLWKFEEYLRTEKRPENVRSLSTRSKNEIVTKKCFRDWLHRLLQQLDVHGSVANSNLLLNDEEMGCPEGSSRTTTDESSLRQTERQRSTDHLISDESPDSSKDNENTLTEHEEEDSDDQRSFTSATSTNSSKSLQLKQGNVPVLEKKKSQNERNS